MKGPLGNPDRVPGLLADLESGSVRPGSGSAGILRVIADRRPEFLGPHFDVFVRHLDHPAKLLQWEAIYILARLVRLDAGSRFESVFDRYFAPIRGPVMITGANVIKAAPRIAAARPDWADRIARKILEVTRARYESAECRRIAIGQAIQAFEGMFELLRDPSPVLRFVRGQIRNSRPATRARAARFLQRRKRWRVPSGVRGEPTPGTGVGP